GGDVLPGGPQPFRERALTEVEHGGGEGAPGRHRAAPLVALPVEERMLDDRVAKMCAKRIWEQPHQHPEKCLHERPRASPSRFSATAAVRFSRCEIGRAA